MTRGLYLRGGRRAYLSTEVCNARWFWWPTSSSSAFHGMRQSLHQGDAFKYLRISHTAFNVLCCKLSTRRKHQSGISGEILQSGISGEDWLDWMWQLLQMKTILNAMVLLMHPLLLTMRKMANDAPLLVATMIHLFNGILTNLINF